ncbi:TlyA family RNA methyltransferase [Devosia sp.]|uniref:TlyA family RNA methyltransferase n=1 Tax=Devosia sp. TaxID=1871048 RepID=UPI003BABD451
MSTRIRLDQALEARGLLPSRARARDAVLRGTVTINGVVAVKPHQPVADSDVLALHDPAATYVSRAALKLIAGLDAGKIAATGRTCLDLGASTGGFTQVLMERGASKVFAIDVGHHQLHKSLLDDPRVVSFEGLNGRDLNRDTVPDPIDLLVCDISFVSVVKVLDVPLSLCADRAEAVILIKPQFEVGRENVGKRGIVTDPLAIEKASTDVIAYMAAAGWSHRISVPSPIDGGDGNTETVAVFSRP